MVFCYVFPFRSFVKNRFFWGVVVSRFLPVFGFCSLHFCVFLSAFFFFLLFFHFFFDFPQVAVARKAFLFIFRSFFPAALVFWCLFLVWCWAACCSFFGCALGGRFLVLWCWAACCSFWVGAFWRVFGAISLLFRAHPLDKNQSLYKNHCLHNN